MNMCTYQEMDGCVLFNLMMAIRILVNFAATIKGICVPFSRFTSNDLPALGSHMARLALIINVVELG